ncbi:hypothetical protein A6P54_18200 [Bacillus sp. MKU004]|nr:hypothetical protein A6P54_18200 [Bacillus sp. MKU004]
MERALDIGVTAWAPIAGGALTGKYLNGLAIVKELTEEGRRVVSKYRRDERPYQQGNGSNRRKIERELPPLPRYGYFLNTVYYHHFL